MPGEKPEGVEVILDIFAGRPNPSWILSEGQVRALEKLLGRDYKDKSSVRLRRPPGLGYRGFIISNPGGLRGLPLACRVFGGTINIREAGVTDPSQVYAIEDRNRIEAWLLEQAAQKNLDQDIARLGGPGPAKPG
jgi:hypothetical protein